MKSTATTFVLAAGLWLVVGICAVPPIGWIGWQLGALVMHHGPLVLLPPDSAQFWLLARTVVYAVCAAAIATLLGLLPALVIARGHRLVTAGVVVCAAVSLMLPSIVHTYGWSQLLRLAGYTPAPGSMADIARCIWTLGCWLWGIVAVLVGISLRRVDSDVEAAARLDGGHWRVLLGSVRGSIGIGAAIAVLLAAAEFAVFEPTGIRVVATEARTVYDTGLRTGQAAPVAAGLPLPTQSDRAALTLATVTPLSVVLVGVLGLAVAGLRRADWDVAEPSAAGRPAGKTAGAVTVAILLTTLLLPLLAMVASLSSPQTLSPLRVLEVFWPQFLGTITIGLIVAMAATLLGVLVALTGAALARLPGAVSLVIFSLGGLVLAVAQLRVWSGIDAINDAWPIVVFTHLARLAWIPIFSATWLHTPGWQNLRDAATADGATRFQVARTILLPLGWPIIVAAGALTGLLAMTEVPANLILTPQNPPMLTPMLMAWVHMLRYDDMLVASLLLAALTVTLGGSAAAVIWLMITGRRTERLPTRL